MFENLAQSANSCKPSPRPNKPEKFCPEPPGTILRIAIPAGAAIRLGFIEVKSPSGICIIVRLTKSLLGEKKGISDVMDALKKCGASVEIANEY